jgi:predicted PurR-regulated permease PerM
MEITTRTIFRVLFVTAIFVGGIKFVELALHPLIWIGTAFFLAVALNPSVARVSQYMPKKSRGLSTTVVFFGMLLLIGFLLVSFIPPLVSQTQDFASNLPSVTDNLINGHGFISDQIQRFHLVDRVRDSQNLLGGKLTSAGGSFYGVLKSIFSSVAAGVTVFVLTIFMILEGPYWIETAWKLVPMKKQKNYRKLVQEMYEAVSGYVTGNLATSLIAAILTALMLTITNVPYAIPLGVLVGLIDLIPLVGASIAALIVVLVAFFSGSFTAGIVMIIFFVVYQQIENHILQPLIYGQTVNISPLTVLIAILIGADIGGLLGALVAIPLAASVGIVIKDVAQRKLMGR